ncbi:MAG: hypothetical protein MJB14_23875, partial [Spirochaetes bacterium]|nr:hypothetical protein [Spirochaetota bacterium]
MNKILAIGLIFLSLSAFAEKDDWDDWDDSLNGSTFYDYNPYNPYQYQTSTRTRGFYTADKDNIGVTTRWEREIVSNMMKDKFVDHQIKSNGAKV